MFGNLKRWENCLLGFYQIYGASIGRLNTWKYFEFETLCLSPLLLYLLLTAILLKSTYFHILQGIPYETFLSHIRDHF